MSNPLVIRLLGRFEIQQNGAPIPEIQATKTLALLSYLAVTARPHTRPALAGLLWGGMSEAKARDSLSKALSTLRQKVGTHLTITRQTVSFNKASDCWLDVAEFEARIKSKSIEGLQAAVRLYEGDFLEGFSVRNAVEFDYWLLAQQARLKSLAWQALHTLAAHFAGQDAAGRAKAIDYTRRLLALEPWREEAHRQMMRLLALNGQRGAALAHYETCRQVLTEELDVEPGAETTILFEQIRDGKVGKAASEDTPIEDNNLEIASRTMPRQHNLPADLTPFVGREQELEQVGRLLANEHIRLISIVGMGGMGKTRLAREASRQQLGDFEAGVFFVPLVQVNAPDNIPNAIADTMGFHFYSTDAPLQQLINYLHQKQVLFVLDNFEHLISGCAVVSDILRGAPQVKILVTTRQPLRLRGETRLNLFGMEIQAWQSAGQARTASVVQLFLQSAQRIQPEFRLDDENFRLVLTICHLVQGMPLGVELAASWVDVFTLKEIAQGISAEIDFLVADFHDVPERHRSLRVVLEQSLRLLDEKESDIFVQLCIFRGGFSRDAAQQVVGADIRTLTTLVNKSLVQRDPAGRFAIHELLRQFGETSLKNKPDIYDKVRYDHTCYYCRFLDNLENALNFGDGQTACTHIEQELGNIHLAWEWACRHGLFDYLIKAEYAIFLFREYQNRFQEMEQMYQAAVRYLTPLEPDPKRDFFLANVLRCQAWTALRYGQIERGLKLGLRGWEYLVKSKLPLRKGGNDPRAPLTVLYTINGDFETARQFGVEMLHHHRDRGDSVNKIIAYYALSTLELAEGRYEQVRQYGRMALADFDATGHKYLWSYFLNNWGNAERALGNFDEAKHLFRESYNHMHDLGSTEGMTTALNNIANIAILQADYNKAWEIFEQNIAIYRNLGDIGGIAMTLEGLGRIAVHQKDHRQAAQLFSEALQTAGTSLSSITLSILIRVSRLFLETNLQEEAHEILMLVMHHPASNQEIIERAQRQLKDFDLDLSAENEAISLETIQSEVVQVLNRHDYDWQTHAKPLLEKSLGLSPSPKNCSPR